MKVINKNTLNSTSEYIKKFTQNKQDMVVFAKRQTKGKGTKQRFFVSKKGGMYGTFLTFFDDLDANNSFKIMVCSSMAAVKTLRQFGVICGIKWPNDIYANGKKICGILTENAISGGKIVYSQVGVGININNNLPNELKNKATSVKQILHSKISLSKFKKAFIYNFYKKEYSIAEYKSNLIILGKQVEIISQEKTYLASVLDVSEFGQLVIDVNGQIQKLSAGEVSVIM